MKSLEAEVHMTAGKTQIQKFGPLCSHTDSGFCVIGISQNSIEGRITVKNQVILLLKRQIKGENNKVSKIRDLAVEESRSSMFPTRKLQGYPQTLRLFLHVGT